MGHHLIEDYEILAEAVELVKLRAINALLARRVCVVFAMRVSDMGIAQRELADASVLIDREKRKSGSLSYVVVAVFRARHCFRDRERAVTRSEEHTSELQSLMRISDAVFCLKKKISKTTKLY